MSQNDPYWDAFIHRAPADPNNLITHAFAHVQPGEVNPVKSEVHSPNVMAGHIKELGRFFGADRVGIVALAGDRAGFSAIVCTLKTEFDTRSAGGIGGQAPALKGLFVSFNLCAVIKEMGYRATRTTDERDRLAGLVGVGVQGPGRHVAEVVCTDLPLAPDQHEVLV